MGTIHWIDWVTGGFALNAIDEYKMPPLEVQKYQKILHCTLRQMEESVLTEFVKSLKRQGKIKVAGKVIV